MGNQKKLVDFEREYYAEIASYVVTEKDLVAAKVPPKALAYEVYLRKVFGDSFAHAQSVDDYDDKSKMKIEKVSKDKLNTNEFNNIMSDIEKSEFDDNLDMILREKSKE